MACKKRYADLFHALNGKNSSIWNDGSRKECKWETSKNFPQFFELNCKCEGKVPIKRAELIKEYDDICKHNYFHTEFLFSHEIYANKKGKSGDETRVMLKSQPLKIIMTQQSHAMTLIDLFSGVGGFLGLLVGASVITVLEFVEFLCLGGFGVLKNCASRKRATTTL